MINKADKHELDSIEAIEKELSELAHSDMTTWTRMYILMEKVDVGKLYSGKYHSFTAWVKSLATEIKTHESVLWARYKAGKVYSQFLGRAGNASNNNNDNNDNNKVPRLEQIKLSPENLNLVSNIAGNNTDVADDLIHKMLDGEVSKKDLKAAWARVKADRAERGIYSPKNSYDARNQAKEAAVVNEKKSASGLTAADLVLTLNNASWLPAEIRELNSEADKYNKNRYYTSTEFPVRPGTTKHARRIDLLVAENYTVSSFNKMYNMKLHCIEIKVDANDLKNDEKMQEYHYFVDFCWLAVTEDILDVAREYAADKWGIIVISKDKDNRSFNIVIDRVAKNIFEEKHFKYKVEALSTLLYKNNNL